MRFWITMASILLAEVYCLLHGTTLKDVSLGLVIAVGVVALSGLLMDILEFEKKMKGGNE